MITSVRTRNPEIACDILAAFDKGYNAAGKVFDLNDPACLSPEAYAALYPSNGVSSDEEDVDDDKDLPAATAENRRYAQQDYDYYVSLEQDSAQDQARRGGDEKEEGGKSGGGDDKEEGHAGESDDERREREFRRKFPAGLADIVKKARKSGINLVTLQNFESFAGGVGVGKDLERYLEWVPKLRSEGWEIDGGIEKQVYWVWAVLRRDEVNVEPIQSSTKGLIKISSGWPPQPLVQLVPQPSVLHESILLPLLHDRVAAAI